jgi:transglutaminase-like putative cysteine protease
MICDVNHRTLYQYSSPVVQSQHLIHMSPRAVPTQSVRHHSLLIEPAPSLRADGIDAFGNPTVMLDLDVPHREFVLHARSCIETLPPPHIDFASTPPWDRSDDLRHEPAGLIDLDVLQYRCATRLTFGTLEIADYGRQSFTPGRPVLDATMDLMLRIFRDFKFDSTATDVSTPLTDMFRQRRGVCQDFSHLSLACLRAMRVPARYVSGYILTRPPPGQVKLQGTDASHAWIAVWSRGTGWTGFDPTNGVAVRDEHITIAHGRDYDDVSPISGVLLGGGEHTVTVGVDVVATT